MAQQSIVKGDVLQRIGSVGLIVGAILLIVFSLLWPRADDPGNTQAVLQKWGDNERFTQVAALAIAAGLWGVMMGVAGIYRSITAKGAAWARLGFYGVTVATAIWTVLQALTMATAGAAANWVAAPAAGKATAYSVAAAVYTGGVSLFSMSIIVLWLALFFLGVGMALSRVYPRWMGWAIIILGIATVAAVGVVQSFAGITTTSAALFGILALLTSLWALVVGVWVARRAW